MSRVVMASSTALPPSTSGEVGRRAPPRPMQLGMASRRPGGLVHGSPLEDVSLTARPEVRSLHSSLACSSCAPFRNRAAFRLLPPAMSFSPLVVMTGPRRTEETSAGVPHDCRTLGGPDLRADKRASTRARGVVTRRAAAGTGQHPAGEIQSARSTRARDATRRGDLRRANVTVERCSR